jgi:predicted naringenin-chalcone synthase
VDVIARLYGVADLDHAHPTHHTSGDKEHSRAATLARRLAKASRSSGIATRHSCLGGDAADVLLASSKVAGSRARIWEANAPRMALDAAAAAIRSLATRYGASGAAAANSPQAERIRASITHVLGHSCTGFAAPGIEFHIAEELHLPNVQRRIPLSFAGCFGGLTALAMAKHIVESDPAGESAVLLVCSEVCSAHMSSDALTMETAVGSTLFADGAAAAIVASPRLLARLRSCFPATAAPSGKAQTAETGWALAACASETVKDTADKMTWRQSNSVDGHYEMYLDRAIPDLLSTALVSRCLPLLRNAGVHDPFRVDFAIHPGGKAILNGLRPVLKGLSLRAGGLDHSEAVLQGYGNMSSATIFFVLKRMLAAADTADEVFTAGFGPGLTLEYGLLRRVPV